MASSSVLTTEQAQQRLAAYWEEAAGCHEPQPPGSHPPEDVLTQYDRHGGISLRTIQRMVKDGRLRGQKLGRDWLVEAESLDELFTKLDAEREEARASV